MKTEMLIVCLITGVCVAVAAFVGRHGFYQLLDLIEQDFADRLRSLRIKPNRLRAWIHVWLGIAVALFCAIWLATDTVALALSTFLLLAAGPWFLIRRWAIRRREKIEDQLADAMVMFSASIRAGLSLAQALDLLAMECPAPIQQEFSQIIGEYKMGKPMERTLREAKDRLRSENFALFAAALLASRESGGRLNDTVERISRSVLEMQRLERKLHSETAQARKSAVYMAIVPLLILIVYFFVASGEYARVVCHTLRTDRPVHCRGVQPGRLLLGCEDLECRSMSPTSRTAGRDGPTDSRTLPGHGHRRRLEHFLVAAHVENGRFAARRPMALRRQPNQRTAQSGLDLSSFSGCHSAAGETESRRAARPPGRNPTTGPRRRAVTQLVARGVPGAPCS